MSPESTAQFVLDSVPIGQLVRSFFSILDEDGIRWAVLRGSAGLPDRTRYDIDLLMEADELQSAERALERAAAAHGWQKLRITNKFRYRCCLLISSDTPQRFLPVDLFGGCYFRFYPLADAQFALRRRHRNGQGIWVVPAGFGAAEALGKELMRHDVFKENSRSEVQVGARSDAESFVAGVSSIWGTDLTRRLLGACQRGDWLQAESLAPEIRRRIRSFRLKLTWGAMEFAWRNIRHHLKPPMSMFVVLLGPDGAGKSTIGDLVAEELYQRPFKVCRRFEHTFGLLPELKQLKVTAARLLGRKPHVQFAPLPGLKGSGMNKEHGMGRAMLYVLYYSLDRILGHVLIRRVRAQGGLVVFARYFYDYYYQKGYRNVPNWFLRLMEYAVPTPDLILYLHRDAEDVYAGKPELDLDEIRRQQTIIADLVKRRENGHTIDASHGLDATAQEVKRIIVARWLSQVGIIFPRF